MKNLILFASGSGSNVENIYNYFSDNKDINILFVLTNNRNAKVIDRCNRLGINCLFFNKTAFKDDHSLLLLLKKINPDFIVLAGFLWKIPTTWIESFPNKIVNIHPALLPKYGGKGMYGMHVHEAVLANKEKETGITIHFVNENYDEGAIIFQQNVAVEAADTAESIAQKVHQLEYTHFPKIIEQLTCKAAQ
ncbi:MAG: phosphoribosylglycinamide formyltransferase [Flavobacteriaceae bacterium]|nr:phosphoribosylglycinamide formyltransferase [Flavobacteriaceae bacterium]